MRRSMPSPRGTNYASTRSFSRTALGAYDEADSERARMRRKARAFFEDAWRTQWLLRGNWPRA
jgi:hypothetical protein